MPNINNAINPQNLRTARNKRGLSQDQLADNIGCTKDTISRWERGETQNVRTRYRKRLCKELRVNWEDLTKSTDLHETDFADLKAEDTFANLKTKVSISKSVRNSLQLVAKRFNVGQNDILELAPLLFLIVAEQSLLRRKQKLQESETVLEETENKLRENCSHLRAAIATSRIISDSHMWQEEDSINKRDVFGRTIQYDYWDEGDKGPFVHFIRDLAKDLPKDAVTSIDSFDGDRIEMYQIADDTLRECIGISKDKEKEKTLLHYIRCGVIEFAECLRVKRNEDEKTYLQWIAEKLDSAEEESQRWFEEFKDSIGLSPETVSTPDPSEKRSAR